MSKTTADLHVARLARTRGSGVRRTGVAVSSVHNYLVVASTMDRDKLHHPWVRLDLMLSKNASEGKCAEVTIWGRVVNGTPTWTDISDELAAIDWEWPELVGMTVKTEQSESLLFVVMRPHHQWDVTDTSGRTWIPRTFRRGARVAAMRNPSRCDCDRPDGSKCDASFDGMCPALRPL